VYFLAYLYLRLCFPYYLAPVDLIAVLYVGRLAILSWEEMHLWSRAGTVVLLGVVLVQGVSLSAFRVFERKNVTHAKAELATAIASQSDANRVQRLFFLSRSKYIITEFASYLVYRGLRVEGEGSTAGSDNVVIVSKDLAKDELCLDYRNFVCHAGNTGPAPGDLVIELPDDIESQSEINSYRKGGELLFSYEPRPRVQQWMYPMLNCLRVVSFRFRFRELPDRWLHASITRWE
jgi:hypothetical protein